MEFVLISYFFFRANSFIFMTYMMERIEEWHPGGCFGCGTLCNRLIIPSFKLCKRIESSLESNLHETMNEISNAMEQTCGTRWIIFDIGLGASSDIVRDTCKPETFLKCSPVGGLSVHGALREALGICQVVWKGDYVLPLSASVDHLVMVLVASCMILRSKPFHKSEEAVDYAKNALLGFRKRVGVKKSWWSYFRIPGLKKDSNSDLIYISQREISTLAEVIFMMQSNVMIPRDGGDVPRLRWRKLVLRKIILNTVPRISSHNENAETVSNGDGCRPYMMILNGNQTDILCSTLIQGVRNEVYDKNKEIVFEINCIVSEDIVIKLYHLEPGKPGSLIAQMSLNVTSCEPIPSDNELEQWILVPSSKKMLNLNVPSSSFEKELVVSCLLGRPAGDGQESPVSVIDESCESPNPRPHASSLVAAIASPSQLPKLQIRCSTCKCIQHVPSNSSCKKCHAIMDCNMGGVFSSMTCPNSVDTEQVSEAPQQTIDEPNPPVQRRRRSRSRRSGSDRRSGQQNHALSTIDDEMLEASVDELWEFMQNYPISREQLKAGLGIALVGCRTREDVQLAMASYALTIINSVYELFESSLDAPSASSASWMSQLPIHVYHPHQAGEMKACQVCLCDFEDGVELRTLPCFHSYHVDCIDQWLATNVKCPVCLQDINKSFEFE